MKRLLALVAAGACANALLTFVALAQAAPEVTLTRFDCGTRRRRPRSTGASPTPLPMAT